MKILAVRWLTGESGRIVQLTAAGEPVSELVLMQDEVIIQNVMLPWKKNLLASLAVEIVKRYVCFINVKEEVSCILVELHNTAYLYIY